MHVHSKNKKKSLNIKVNVLVPTVRAMPRQNMCLTTKMFEGRFKQ